jgi:hypothetical protein
MGMTQLARVSSAGNKTSKTLTVCPVFYTSAGRYFLPFINPWVASFFSSIVFGNHTGYQYIKKN